MSNGASSSRPGLVGEPSDQVPGILATGNGGITTLFVSMSERHPDGADADYLRWHTLDHRPEQHRLASLRASLRLVSTPECRAVRAVSGGPLAAVDHVMTYLFTDLAGLDGFNALAKALFGAGRVPFVLPPVQRGVYAVGNRVTAPAAKVGADVLPWWPPRGIYLLLEPGAESAASLIDVPGVAGLWSANSVPTEISSAAAGQQITYCFLDDDPVATAGRLRPVLQQRWQQAGITPLFAAPFFPVVPWAWDKYLP